MNLAALRAAALAALAAGANPAEAARAATMAARMAEMVGWALGPIDPRGEVLDVLAAICRAARERFESGGETSFAGLHDALAELAEAIAAHDRDLGPATDDGDDLVAF